MFKNHKPVLVLYFLTYLLGLISLPVFVFIFDRRQSVYLVTANKNGATIERRFEDIDGAINTVHNLMSRGYTDIEFMKIIDISADVRIKNEKIPENNEK